MKKHSARTALVTLVFLFLFVILVTARGLSAQPAQGSAAPGQQDLSNNGIAGISANSGGIDGIVTAVAGGPVSDIAVSAYEAHGSGWSKVKTVISNGSGFYFISGLPPGAYRVGFNDDQGEYLEEFFNNASTIYSANSISVHAGAFVTGVNAVLEPAGHITGKVEAGGDGPIDGIRATAFRSERGDWKSIATSVSLTDGTYHIAGLPAGTYAVFFIDYNERYLAEYFDDVPDIDSAVDIPVSPGSTVPDIDATLTKAGKIRGTITSADDFTPLKNIKAEVYAFTGSRWRTISRYDYTDDNGQYTIGLLAAGVYRVRFTDNSHHAYVGEFFDDAVDLNDAADVSVSSGGTTFNINASLALGGHITGTVIAANGGNLADNVRVCASYAGDSYWLKYTRRCADSDENGSFDIEGLPAGDYIVQFIDDGISSDYLNEYYEDTPYLHHALPVAVTAGATTSAIDAELDKGAHVRGHVSDEERGGDLWNIEVKAFYFNGRWWEPVAYGRSNMEGFYDISQLAAGTYRLQFMVSSPWEHLGEYYDDVQSWKDAEDIVVAEAETIHIRDVELAKGGQISGKVTASEGGDPIHSVGVKAYWFDGTGWQHSSTGYTDQSGLYEIDRLSTGDYRIFFEESNGYFAPQFFDNVLDIEEAVDVSVVAGSKTPNIDAVLSKAGHIKGTVTAADSGDPVGEITVNAYKSDGQKWNLVGHARTDNFGHYSIDGLLSGAYRLGFFDYYEGTFQYEYYEDAGELESATDIIVADGAVVPDVDAIVSIGAAHITGTVTTSFDNAPLVEFNVCTWARDGTTWRKIDFCQESDDRGQYDIGGLRAGSYRVEFHDIDGRFITEYYDDAVTIERAVDVLTTAASTTPGIDAALSTMGRIAGKVTADDGSPLAGIEVTAYRSDGSKWVEATTTESDSSGRYDLVELDAGSYRILFTDSSDAYQAEYYDDAQDVSGATDVVVSLGKVTTSIDAALTAVEKLQLYLPAIVSP